MSKSIVVFSLLGLISACVGQIVQNGQCDDNVPVVADFNVANFAGVWYDIESLPSTFKNGTCNTATYSANTDGTINVQNTQVTNGILQIVTGTAVLTGNAKFDVTISGNLPTAPYWVLATDYDTYALIYSCRNLNAATKQVNSWKLGRNKGVLPLAATNAINSVITNVEALNIVSTHFIRSDHSAEACSHFVDFEGPCPTVAGVANFDVSRYLGTWYEVARYPQPTQTGQCNRAEYALGATAGVVTVLNSQVINEALATISGTATQVAGQSGVLQVTFTVGGEVRNQNLHVLATDYDNYALVYSCSPLADNRRRIGSWQLRKNTNNLDQTAINAINAAIAATPDLQTGYYQETSQTDAACFYYPDFRLQDPATIELPGSCDTSITGVANFDVVRYLGTWYEVARYPQPTQTGQCNRAQYALTAAGTVAVQNSQVINETLVTISGTAAATGEPGLLQVAFIVGGEVRTQNLYVLATDYDNFALLYTCTNIEGNRRQVGSWILSRNTYLLSEEAYTVINNVVTTTQGLKDEYYTVTSQSDATCFYYPVFEQIPAIVELPGPCDTSITGVADFDVVRYLGTWYEVARYPQPTQTGQCNRAQYALAAGFVAVLNSQVINETMVTISGTAIGTGQPGVLQVTFTVGGEVRTQNLYVLATDYDNFAVVYTCTNIEGNKRQVGSWILSRNRNLLSEEANTIISNVVTTTQDLKHEYYMATSQTDEACWRYLPQTGDKVIIPGQCDTSISGMANIDLTAFANSTWYQIQRYDAVGEDSTCIGSRLSYDGSYINVNSIEVIGGEVKHTEGVARITAADSGKFSLQMADTEDPEEIYILATDYHGYAIAYSCKNIGTDYRQIGAWQLSRGRTMPPAGEAAIDTLVAERQEFTRAPTYFKPISHAGDCPEPSFAFSF